MYRSVASLRGVENEKLDVHGIVFLRIDSSPLYFCEIERREDYRISHRFLIMLHTVVCRVKVVQLLSIDFSLFWTYLLLVDCCRV